MSMATGQAAEPPSEKVVHVDEWVQDVGFDDKPEDGNVMYARWLLMHFRLHAHMQENFGPFVKGKKLFCTYKGVRYRCTGASRLGDVWLTTNFNQSVGYEKRVNVALCKAWSPTSDSF